MALIDLYNSSKQQNVVDARKIPAEETDFFDSEHTFSDGFTSNMQPGDPTQLKAAALNYFDTLEKDFVPPSNFIPLDGAPGLDAWTAGNPYGSDGSPKS